MLCGGPAMPEFTTLPVQEAQIRTIPGRPGQFINEYADYIQQLPRGQAGRLQGGEHENPLTIRRRLVSAAKALGIHIIIKRSGNDLYFWQGSGEAEPRTRRSYTRRRRMDEQTAGQDQPRSTKESAAPDDFEEQVTRLESEMPNSTL
jgi:hypothetical protein